MRFFDRATGKYKKSKRQNMLETQQSLVRDKGERDRLIHSHVGQRQSLKNRKLHLSTFKKNIDHTLDQDIQSYADMAVDQNLTPKPKLSISKRQSQSINRNRLGL